MTLRSCLVGLKFEIVLFILLMSFGRRSGLMVSVLASRASGPGFGPRRVHCFVFLGQDTLLPQCLSSPRCINRYRQNAGGNPAMD